MRMANGFVTDLLMRERFRRVRPYTYEWSGGHEGVASDVEMRAWGARLEGLSCPPTKRVVCESC